MRTCKLILLIISVTATMTANCAVTLDSLRAEADRLHAEGQNDSAVIIAQKALAMAQKEGNTTAIVGINSSMGVYLRTQGKLNEALEHYNRAMQLCTDESFMRTTGEDGRQEAAALYLNLATLHIDMQHKEDALKYARQGADWALKCSDKAFKAQLLAQDGLIFLMCGDNGEAARLLSLAYDNAMQTKLYPAALNAGAYMIAVADRMGDAAADGLWRGRCRQLEDKVTDTMALIAYRQILCSVALNNGKWRESIDLFNLILSTKGVGNMPFVVYDCYNNMHEAWAKLGEWRKAYDCLGRAVALKDSLFEKDKAESMRELTVKYQTKEKELALARSEAELAETRMYIAMAVLAVLACALLVALYVQRQRRRMREREAEYARLKADVDKRLTRRYLEGLENERSRLAKELHDGVCNSLYTMQLMAAKNTGSAETYNSMLGGIREQVRRVSHELMPSEFRFADISMVLDDYLADAADASGCGMTFTPRPAEADWKAVPDATALELYRITQEAVSNAVKHSGATRIDVALELSLDAVTLTVTDNGREHRRGGRGGIGRRTMRQRADAISGTLSVKQDVTGTTLTVRAGINRKE